MKKFVITLLVICLFFPIISAVTLTVNAAGNNTVIIFEGAEKSENTVKIDVNVKENSGVYSMLLALEYDTNALTLTNVEYGVAFEGLEPVSSGGFQVSPYKISYLGTDNKNDTSIGKMLSLTFTIKENAPNGEYKVTFNYVKNQDVTYLKNGEITTKNLIISGAKITLLENEIEKVQTEQNAGNNNDKLNIVFIIIGSVFGVAFVAAIVVLIIFKRKGKWVKL